MPALICGSLAFDTIANFHGRFADQILADQIHILNVSFLVPTMRRDFGGCAGNIAYNLKGLGGVPRGTIRELRVVQIFPKLTHVANQPPVGMASEENPRAILGTVPVEADGSARFLVPASRPLLFQALDADGFAYQTMRSVTYVQPGERISCVGCHERPTSPPADRGRRGPSAASRRRFRPARVQGGSA